MYVLPPSYGKVQLLSIITKVALCRFLHSSLGRVSRWEATPKREWAGENDSRAEPLPPCQPLTALKEKVSCRELCYTAASFLTTPGHEVRLVLVSPKNSITEKGQTHTYTHTECVNETYMEQNCFSFLIHFGERLTGEEEKDCV